MRGATRRSVRRPSQERNFNPHSPCGERPRLAIADRALDVFQSTLPLRGATPAHGDLLEDARISIHTPLAGSDFAELRRLAHVRKFQSTLPLRGATFRRFHAHAPRRFQSTLPLRGATRIRRQTNNASKISIHTPLAGSDPSSTAIGHGSASFQSTLPLRGATCPVCDFDARNQISIHTPLAGSD